MDSASARPCFDGTTRGSSRISGLSRHVAVVNLALVCVGYNNHMYEATWVINQFILLLQWFFLGLDCLAILGMGILLLLHAFHKLATGSKGRPDKKRGFTLGGIFSKLNLALKYEIKRKESCISPTVIFDFHFNVSCL